MKKDTDTIPAHVRKQIKKTKPYTLTLTKAQADYQNSLDDSKKILKKQVLQVPKRLAHHLILIKMMILNRYLPATAQLAPVKSAQRIKLL